MSGGDFKNAALCNPVFRNFLKQYPEECLDIVIFAAFGFKNNAERAAVRLLKEYNERQNKNLLYNMREWAVAEWVKAVNNE